MNNYDSTQAYPRDLIGYGNTPPEVTWPTRARVAVQFVLNYEEGGERNVLHGDRYVIEGIDKVEPNARVCTEVDANRFLEMFVSRIRGK